MGKPDSAEAKKRRRRVAASFVAQTWNIPGHSTQFQRLSVSRQACPHGMSDYSDIQITRSNQWPLRVSLPVCETRIADS